MYLEDAVTHSLTRVQRKLSDDQGSLEARIIKSTNEHDKYRMLRELEYVIIKSIEVGQQLEKRTAELTKPKSFWEKLFRK